MSDVSQIQRKYAVAQDTEPVSPFAGQLWRDTSNNTLKVYDADSESWTSVQTSPDDMTTQLNGSGELEVITANESLGTDSNGNIRVEKPSNKLVGDFENGNDGWSLSGGSRNTNGYNSSWSIELPGYEDSASQNFDLTGVSEIQVRAQGDGYLNLYLDGTNIDSKNLENLGNDYYLFKFDASSYTGSTTIKWENRNTSGALDFDKVVLVVGGLRIDGGNLS